MMEKIEIIPLGIGGWIPNETRQTACVVVKQNRHAIIFDLGTGISRLLESSLKNLLGGISRLDILLSHYHLDHVVGLTWLPKFWTKDFSLYAPTKPWIESEYSDALERLTGPPLFALPLENYPGNVNIVPITKTEIEIGEFEIKILPQVHPGGSLAFCMDNNFAYITDVDPDEQHIAFLKNVKIAFVDTMYDVELYKNTTNNFIKKADHGYSEGVANLAKKADVERLGLIHINPGFGGRKLNNFFNEAKQVFKNCFIPKEGEIING